MNYNICWSSDVRYWQITIAHPFEPTASGGWLKVRRYAEVPEQDEHLPLLSIYMAIC
jgi:hypothetical protein